MNKIGFLTALVTAILVFTLAFPVAAAGPKVPAAPVPAVPAMALATPMPAHPHIHEALESMRAAKHHLEQAAHDFEGHRAKAMEHLDAAIHEAEVCESMK